MECGSQSLDRRRTGSKRVRPRRFPRRPPPARFPPAIDTEADSLHSFRELLASSSSVAPAEHAIIDPLKIKGLGPLLDFLKDSEVWTHGAEFHMSLFKRTFDFVPPRVLDTQVARASAGAAQSRLAHLRQRALASPSRNNDSAPTGAGDCLLRK